ncbi:MAG: YkgJ family cysteine cluster protein [Thermoplasmata archaeon]|nr:YkgJ family cysteine cluster protein [Thermoplasmata archaeon]
MTSIVWLIAMEIDINKIRKQSKEKEDENWEFRSFLKGCGIPTGELDSLVHRLYQKVSSEIDCKKCANCCKEVPPILDKDDIEKFSKSLGISNVQFKEKFLVEDKEANGFIFNKKPCPFLKNNLCSHYPNRPKGCISYPHLHKSGFVFRLMDVIHNCSVCPIAFNVYEFLKDEINFKCVE